MTSDGNGYGISCFADIFGPGIWTGSAQVVRFVDITLKGEDSMKLAIARTAVALAALGMAAGASAQMKPEDMIKFRQSGYAFMAWNMGKIKAQVIDGSVAYDKAQVEAAANVIAAVANSGMGALYAPGTDEGKGWEETRLKSAFFQEPDKVKEIAINFVKQANALKEVAAGGDQAAIKAQFGEVGKACKACHERYREED